MRKIFAVCVGLLFIAGCLFVTGCGGGKEASSTGGVDAQSKVLPKDAEKIKSAVLNKMKKMQDGIKEFTGEAACELALAEAKKWDRAAQVYYLEGEDSLKPDGTAKNWRANFAISEDPENGKQGKKFVVLMLGGKVVRMEKKETPDEIAYTTDCRAFLPGNRMSGDAAYEKCLEALKAKYGNGMDGAVPDRLECLSGEYYISSKWVIKPTWRLTMQMDGSPISAAIQAVSGEVLVVK